MLRQMLKRSAGIDCDPLMVTLVMSIEGGLSELCGAGVQLIG
jgi:hypothetical protein